MLITAMLLETDRPADDSVLLSVGQSVRQFNVHTGSSM